MITLLQMEYFLEVVRSHSITTAAKHLYVTQPTLGRQLTAMEEELNMQLLFRTYKGVQPTPAGEIFFKRFTEILNLYKYSVEEAQNASYGYSGKLSVGILDGLNVSELLSDILNYFASQYPNIEINIHQKSFGELVADLQVQQLDAVISLDVNFMKQKGFRLWNLKHYQPAIIIPKGHPLAHKDNLSLTDFKDTTFVIVDDSDCYFGIEYVKNQFQLLAGFTPSFQYVDTMRDALLWIESGQRCSVLNTSMQIVNNPAVEFYPIDVPDENVIQLAVLEQNFDYAIQLLVNYVKDTFKHK